jgi:hypothetical protein
MPTEHIIALLIAERDKLNRAIEALQGSAKRRGRPPKNPLAAIVTPVAAPAKKRKRQSAARRKAQGERMYCRTARDTKIHFVPQSAQSLLDFVRHPVPAACSQRPRRKIAEGYRFREDKAQVRSQAGLLAGRRYFRSYWPLSRVCLPTAVNRNAQGRCLGSGLRQRLRKKASIRKLIASHALM